MTPLTLFSWGYWGWGTAAERLIKAVDAVEVARGFAPPVFTDIRLIRQGQAPMFVGRKFETLLGEERHRWFGGLGNVAVRDGGEMRLRSPNDVNLLLNLAIEEAQSRRRVLFFCACPPENNVHCHRCLVATRTLLAARQRKVVAEIVEWPGGEPMADRELTLSRADFAKVRRGARSVPLREPFDLAAWAALPWYSVVTVRERPGSGAMAVRTGPARFTPARGGWHLPVFADAVEADAVGTLLRESVERFATEGFERRTA